MKEKMRLSPCALGFSLGLISGLSLLIITYVYMWHGYYGKGIVNFFESIYPWYTNTITGGLFGFLWMFLDFFIFGALVAMVYNKCCKCCCKK